MPGENPRANLARPASSVVRFGPYELDLKCKVIADLNATMPHLNAVGVVYEPVWQGQSSISKPCKPARAKRIMLYRARVLTKLE